MQFNVLKAILLEQQRPLGVLTNIEDQMCYRRIIVFSFIITVFVSCGIPAEEFVINNSNAYSKDIEIEGHLALKTFYGPPNYGETPDMDAIEKYYCVELLRPIKVIVSSEKVHDNVNELQLVFQQERTSGIDTIDLKKQVSIKGKLFLANTGHHHTDILVLVDTITNF